VHRRVAGRPSIHLHEGVWPSAADRERIRLREAQAINHNALLAAWRTGAGGENGLVKTLVDAAYDVYLAAWGPERDLRVIDGPDGFTYLFDTADTPAPEPPARLVAAWGWSGRRWRAIERELAKRPGAFVWQRLLYDSSDDVPAVFETVRMLDGCEAVVDRFVNRAVIRAEFAQLAPAERAPRQTWRQAAISNLPQT
jgi:hypothetical protein